MWTYSQSSGELKHDSRWCGIGYSGHGVGKNNGAYQQVHNVGPIPRGQWTILAPFDSPDHGPYCLRLVPCPSTECFGRDGLMAHGDSREHPGEASLGCVILARALREAIWESRDHELTVVE